MARDFIWFQVRDLTTGAPVTDGYWSDVGDVNAQIIDPDTGNIDTRPFAGAGSLISISDIPLVSNLTVQNITVTLSQVADRVNQLVRGYDCKQGRVEIYRGLFDPADAPDGGAGRTAVCRLYRPGADHHAEGRR